jgi:hypothetical protein
VIDAGGVGAVNTSIWVVVWGPNTMHGLFPKGQISGLQHRDLGEWTLTDAVNNQYQGYRTHFKWDMGFTVRDWRYAVRIANIDAANLRAVPRRTSSTAHPRRASPAHGAARGLERADGRRAGQGCDERWVAPPSTATSTMGTYLDIQALNKTNVLLKYEEWDGKPVTTFRGIPIRTCDQILNTEARV